MAEVRSGSVDRPYTCSCSWTAVHACPGAPIAGSDGYAVDDRSLCFYHCCPTSCAFWDLAGHCLRNKEPDAVPYEQALRRADGYTLTNIALGNDCEETWVMSNVATMVTRLIRHGIEHMKLPIQVQHYLPPNSDMRVLTVNGGILLLENVTVSRVTPSTLKYGLCYDDYEWWVQQPWYVRLANERPPDRMSVISTNIEVSGCIAHIHALPPFTATNEPSRRRCTYLFVGASDTRPLPPCLSSPRSISSTSCTRTC
jgi:hypothetical protein